MDCSNFSYNSSSLFSHQKIMEGKEILIKISIIVLNLMFVFSLVMFLVFLYWLVLMPSKVLIAQKENYTLEKYVYKKGENLLINFNQCKLIDVVGESSGEFIDGVVFTTPVFHRQLEKGCYKTLVATVKVPETLPAGKYYYTEVIKYRLNPLKQVQYRFSTPKFEVID